MFGYGILNRVIGTSGDRVIGKTKADTEALQRDLFLQDTGLSRNLSMRLAQKIVHSGFPITRCPDDPITRFVVDFSLC
jgi:hypothetical protein